MIRGIVEQDDGLVTPVKIFKIKLCTQVAQESDDDFTISLAGG